MWWASLCAHKAFLLLFFVVVVTVVALVVVVILAVLAVFLVALKYKITQQQICTELQKKSEKHLNKCTREISRVAYA